MNTGIIEGLAYGQQTAGRPPKISQDRTRMRNIGTKNLPVPTYRRIILN